MDDPDTFDDALDMIDELRQRNEELLVQVMRLQGQSRQITDVEVAERFDKLYDAIRSWTQSYRQDLLRSGWSLQDFQQELQNEPEQACLAELLRRGDKRMDIKWAGWLARHNSCLHVILTLRLWLFLNDTIFSKSLPPGFEADSLHDAVSSILTVIKHSEGGEAAARKWKAYTIDTLSEASRLQGKKHEFLKSSLDELAALWPFSSLGLSPSQRANLGASVLSLAADLKKDMDCSMFEYHMEEPAYKYGELPDKARLHGWRLQSVAQWIPITGDDDVQGVFRCLYPGITRTSAEDTERIRVLKPTVLVYDTAGPRAPSPRRREHPPADSLPEPAPRRQPLRQSYSDFPYSTSPPPIILPGEHYDRERRRRKSVTEGRSTGRPASPRSGVGSVWSGISHRIKSGWTAPSYGTESRRSSGSSGKGWRRRRHDKSVSRPPSPSSSPPPLPPLPSQPPFTQTAEAAVTSRQQQWDDAVPYAGGGPKGNASSDHQLTVNVATYRFDSPAVYTIPAGWAGTDNV